MPTWGFDRSKAEVVLQLGSQQDSDSQSIFACIFIMNDLRSGAEVEAAWRPDNEWFKHQYHLGPSMDSSLKFEVGFDKNTNFAHSSSAGSTY